MVAARLIYYFIYMLIYFWIAFFLAWNVFVQKNTYRAVGAAMCMVPFVLRMLNLK